METTYGYNDIEKEIQVILCLLPEIRYARILWRYLYRSNAKFMSGGQNLEGRNVERPIFRNFIIANIKMTKDELFDNFIF